MCDFTKTANDQQTDHRLLCRMIAALMYVYRNYFLLLFANFDSNIDSNIDDMFNKKQENDDVSHHQQKKCVNVNSCFD